MSEPGFPVDPAQFARSIATTPGARLAEGLRGEPRVPILDEIFRRMDAVNSLELVTGNASGPELFVTGRLRVEGDVMFAAQITDVFAVPSA